LIPGGTGIYRGGKDEKFAHNDLWVTKFKEDEVPGKLLAQNVVERLTTRKSRTRIALVHDERAISPRPRLVGHARGLVRLQNRPRAFWTGAAEGE
jgi:hypothetical protein